MMAQAARLSLRMQKELKLLLSDPPPGASFPLLSPDSELSSLSSIDAQIEGPEGTVYAEGLFRIRIQIPDRYPFQPPSVTFATPIYHPNIDNGGRICLDILNLPPKGAWQPSLNISTVLTSIGLLLSEPNPDDGLMCEVSKEYKYNRQAFDQKARSLTQKYAKDGASGSGWGCQSDQNDFKTSTVEVDNAGWGSSHVVDENVLGHKKCGTKWKLSLDSSGLIHHRDADGKRNDLPNEYILPSKCRNRVENEEAKEASKGMNDNCGQSQDKLCGTRWKLSQEIFDEFQKKDDNDEENQVPKWSRSSEALELSVASSRSSRLKADNHHDDQEQDSKPMENRINVIAKRLTVGRQQSLGASDACQISYGFSEEMIVNHCKFDSNASYEASPILPAVNYIKQLHKDSSNCMGSGYGDLNCKTPCSSRKRLSLGFRDSSETQGKNRLRPSKVSSTSSFTFNEKGSEIASLDANRKKRRIVGKLSQGPLSQSQQSEDDEEQLLKHSQKPSEDPSKALHMQQDSRCDDKLKSSNDEDCRIDEGIKRQKTDESPMPDSVIVLDSEDSDVEEDVYSRSKSLLARKRIGKWRAKA